MFHYTVEVEVGKAICLRSSGKKVVEINIINTSGQNIYIGTDKVSSADGFLLRPNDHLSIVESPDEVWITGSSAKAKVRVLETRVK